MGWSVWLPIAIATLSLGVSVWAHAVGRSARRELREEDEELRRRIARSELADVSATFVGFTRQLHSAKFVVRVANAGPAVARDIRLRIMTSMTETGAPVWQRSVDRIAAVPVGESVDSTFLLTAEDVSEGMIVKLFASWVDGGGHHDESMLDLRDGIPD